MREFIAAIPVPVLNDDMGSSDVPTNARATPAGPSFLDILKCRDAWGVFLGGNCYAYAFFFLLTWLPKYLVDVRHLSANQLSVLGSMPFLASAVAAILAGWLSDRWIKQGASPTNTQSRRCRRIRDCV